MKCRVEGCEFVVPADSKHPINSLRSHERNRHEDNSWQRKGRINFSAKAVEKRTKRDFLCIYVNSGTFPLTMEHAENFGMQVDEAICKAWINEYEEALDDGKELISDNDVARMKRRMLVAEEWDARRTNRMNRAALQKAGQSYLDGQVSLAEMGTAHRYLGDNWHWGEKAVKEAYGQPVQPQQLTRINNRFTINAGAPPPKRLRAGKPAQIIDAVVRELPVADSDST